MNLILENWSVRQGEFVLAIGAMEVLNQQILAVTGPSGSGKSSLLLSLAGFLAPTPESRLYFGGKRLDLLPPELRQAAFLMQEPALFPHLTVLQNVQFPISVRGVDGTRSAAQASKWLELMRVPELAERRVTQISGGQAQRVAFARALATEYPLLLVDEPFAALEKHLRRELATELRTLFKQLGKTVVWVTHDEEEADLISDRRLRLILGRPA